MKTYNNNTGRNLLKSLFSIKSIVPALIIILAFHLTIFDSLFGLKRDQVILLVLGLLAIDSMTSRLYILRNIETKISNLYSKYTSNHDEVFGFRGSFGTTPDLLRIGKMEMWISGVALDSISQQTSILIDQAREGVTIKLLAIEPEKKVINETASYFNDDTRVLTNRLEANLNNIYKKAIKKYPEKIKLRIISHRPTLGYFIINPNGTDGYMRVEPYICKTERLERPIFQLDKSSHNEWFDIYSEDFQKLWDSAKEWIPR